MIIKTVAAEVQNSKAYTKHNLPECKVLGSHSSVVVDLSLFGCGAVLQGVGIIMLCCRALAL